MSGRLGPIEICCDAPPYAIVQACRRIGLQRPEDVRWLRMSEPRSHKGAPWKLQTFLWRTDNRLCCPCGERLPELALVMFTFNTGEEASYFLGQCARCHTVFWDEP